MQQTPRAAPVGGLTCGRAGLGSGRPHHITTSTTQRGLVGLTGAVKPSHPILPSLSPLSLSPSAIFSVSFPINITTFIPTAFKRASATTQLQGLNKRVPELVGRVVQAIRDGVKSLFNPLLELFCVNTANT